MTRRLAAFAGALAALVACRGAAAAQPGLQVAPALAAFPQRALVLTLPQAATLGPHRVRVFENGVPVSGVDVEPARAAAGSFGFVLAVDTSESMRGTPAAAALAAARAFTAERMPRAVLGVVAFDGATRVVLAPTTDGATIAATLQEQPRLAVGTRLRDGVVRAIRLLQGSHVSARAVVVLSDGADVGSRTSMDALVRLAQAARTRVFAVGLHSPQFDPTALRALAARTGGRYVEARDAAALEPIYRELGRELAGEYLVTYTSSAAPGARVHVSVQVAGVAGAAGLAYGAPGAAVHREPWRDRLLRSPAGEAGVAALVALLAGTALLLARRALRRSPAARVAPYLRAERRRHEPESSSRERLTRTLERAFARLRGWSGFADTVEVAQIGVPAAALALGAAAGALFVAALAVLAGASWLAVLAVAPPLAVRAVVHARLARTRRRFEDDLPDNLQVLASALRAGYGLSGALGVVARDADEPTRSELERALADERLGRPLEDALSAVATRMRSGDLEQVALVVALHRETGGNTAEVLDRVHDAIRERAELRRMVRSLTAEGRMTRWVLTGLPVVLSVAIGALNPGYLQPLFGTTAGRVLLVLAAAMVATGSWTIKRIVEIEV